jgi:hypothetical protein
MNIRYCDVLICILPIGYVVMEMLFFLCFLAKYSQELNYNHLLTVVLRSVRAGHEIMSAIAIQYIVKVIEAHCVMH